MPLSALTQEAPRTVAEASGFRATSRHADVMGFIRDLQRLSSLVRVETLATSAEGRQVPLLIIGDPLPASPADLRHDDRAVVYFQANIHAGEVEGKEAAQMLARDLLTGRTRIYLDRLVILITRIFNADGNEKISTDNRANQDGPEEGVGIRYNGQNLDLNRDGVKLESPEVRGLVRNVLRRWDPVFFLDSHTHNGSYHQEPVTWTWGLNPNGDPAILDYMANTLLPAVTTRTREVYGTLSIPHGDFLDVTDPERGWIPLGPEPRYLSNYVGLRNRFSILNEQYPYVDFETRVRGAYSLFLTFLDYLHENKDEIVGLVREADRRAVGRGLDPAGRDVHVVEVGREPIAERLTILGWEMELSQTAGGRRRVVLSDQERIYEEVPYLAKYTPQRTVPLPRGYLIPAADTRVLDNLLTHGITVERLVEPVTLTVEAFTVTELTGSQRPNQGHYLSSVTGEYSTENHAFPTGTLYVSSSQVLGALAAHLLEPESEDGLLIWNFFDRYLTRQFGGGAATFPVYKLHERVNLVTETVPGG
jgi:hypothetical protein